MTAINRREELKAISAPFKMLVKEGAIASINAGLAQYYAEQGHTTLKTFKTWVMEGFKVKKGSKALLLWAEPKKIKNKKDEEKEDSFFPVAYVFSNLQVEENKTGATPV